MDSNKLTGFRGLLPLVALLVLTVVAAGGCALIERQGGGSSGGLPSLAAPPPLQPSGGVRSAEGLPNISDVAAMVRPAVVSITTREVSLDTFLQPVQQEGAGSGVIFDRQGYVITNNHVIENARNIQVTLPDGRTFDRVTVVGRDPQTDLAVLRIQTAGDFPVARLGNSDELRVGDWIVAIGNALGLEGGPTVTAGVVGALGRSIVERSNVTLDDLIQTDAAINPGNSGGPLVNLAGEVVGINTAIDTRGQGIGFSISINAARPVIEQLVRTGRVVRAFMGVRVATMSPAIAAQLRVPMVEGVVIVAVVRGSPALQAGLQPGDIITKLDGTAVKNVKDLQSFFRGKRPRDQVQVAATRNGREQTLQMTLDEAPAGGS